MPGNHNGAERPPTDYRKIRRNQERMQLILVLFMLVVVGTGLIGLIWGARSALLGGACLLSGAVLIGGLWLGLSLIQRLIDE
jgi:hypothetical protein